MTRILNSEARILFRRVHFLFAEDEKLYYLHFSDYCPHVSHHVYHNVSAVVRSGLLQVVGMSNFSRVLHDGESYSVEKSGVADHLWREQGDHPPLQDQVEIIDKEYHWKIRKLKESAHMLGNKNFLRRPSTEINTIREPVIRSAKEKQ